jgi:hypothetical protein
VRILFLFLLSLNFAFAQQNVSGLIVDSEGRPVQNALVQAPELALQTQSNENGEFSLSLTSAAIISVTAENFETYINEVNPGDVLTISLIAVITSVVEDDFTMMS